jgi:hypothetical protein
LRWRMIGFTADLHRFAILDRYAHRACIGAIVRAYGSGKLGWSVHRESVNQGKRWQIMEFYYGHYAIDRPMAQIVAA